MVTKTDSSLIVHDGGTIKDVLDTAKPIANYTALRAYAGTATQVRITDPGIAGFFYYDASDTTSVDNSGTVIVSSNGKRWKRLFDRIVLASWFGAKGDWNGTTGTDDTATLNSLFDFCRASGFVAGGIPGKTYRITSTLNINCNADFSSSSVSLPSTFSSVAIKTSSATLGVNLLLGLNIKYPSLSNSRAVGTVPVSGSVGIMLEGARNCTFEFGSIFGFDTNLLLYSNNTNRYISYNQFYFTNMFVGATINIHLHVESSGWINQCTWMGGQFAQYGADSLAFNTINLKITKSDIGGNNPPNGHTFVGCSMEGNFYRTIQYALNVGINTSFFSVNTFFNCRFEGSTAFEFSSLALYNNFIGCAYFEQATFINNIIPNCISTRMVRYMNESAPVIGTAGARADKEVVYFGAANNGSAAAIAVGVNSQFNASITGSGQIQSFYSGLPTAEYPGVELNCVSGIAKIAFGDGTAAPATSLYLNSTQIRTNASIFLPSTDKSSSLGANGVRWSSVYSDTLRPGSGTATWTSGTGSPEGAVIANPGSIYTRTDGSTGTTLYVKETGTGNAGWVAK